MSSAEPEDSAAPPSLTDLLRKLVPLSLSDAAMALGDPLLAMTMTRLPAPQMHLAALGVVKAIANFFESPIIMMLHASTALSGTAASRAALWRFMLGMSALLTLLFGLLGLPAIYTKLMMSGYSLTPDVVHDARSPFLVMLLWPAVIAWRRFFQGLLIRQGRGRYMGMASLGRLGSFALVLAGALALRSSCGSLVGATALMVGLFVEAGLVTYWARKGPAPAEEANVCLPSSLPAVWRFYAPLAGTMVLVWGGRAALVALIARSRDAGLALAAWPASWGFVILVANVTRMVQQLVIAHATRVPARVLFQLALVAGIACSVVLGCLGFTSWGIEILSVLLGGDMPVVAASVPILRLSCPLPLLVSLQNTLQGFSIAGGHSGRVNLASLIGTSIMLAVAAALIVRGLAGASAAAAAVCLGVATEVLTLAGWRPWKRLAVNR